MEHIEWFRRFAASYMRWTHFNFDRIVRDVVQKHRFPAKEIQVSNQFFQSVQKIADPAKIIIVSKKSLAKERVPSPNFDRLMREAQWRPVMTERTDRQRHVITLYEQHRDERRASRLLPVFILIVILTLVFMWQH